MWPPVATHSEQVGARVKYLRLSRCPGESVRGFAQRTGINYAHLSKIESGKLTPTLPVLEKVAGGLGVELAEFFPEEKK